MKFISYSIAGAIILILVGAAFYFYKPGMSQVTDFESCVAAGNPVMESFPEQCHTKDGKQFTRDIGTVLEKINMVRVEYPQPGDFITSPLTVTGEARGNWYFEASFPVTLTDNEGNILVQYYAQALQEWMTTEFVPFSSTFEFTIPEGVTRGYLILHKDNPSGLPEHDDEVRFPVKFK